MPSAPQTPEAAPSADAKPAAPSRPDWVSDDAWDAEKGVNLDKVGERVKALSKFEEDQKARLADIPEKAEDYVFFGDDYKAPEGMALLDRDSEVWKQAAEFAKANGWTRKEAAANADFFVKTQAAIAQTQQKMWDAGLAARDQALGENGAQRVDAVGKFFDGFFKDSPKIAELLRYAMVAPEQVQGFEKLIAAAKAGGVTSINGAGRENGKPDNKPANWDTMSAVDRRTWQLNNPQSA